MRFLCVVTLVFAGLIACTQDAAEPLVETPEGILAEAIDAHGGFNALRSASTWKAEIRRHQRGSSYVMTNYYRPGMVRLEQDQGDGSRSADVIGDPHCWGMAGVVSITCSPETRENDRPRVIMEMAMQLWPLLQEPWELRSVSKLEVGEQVFDVVEAYYAPRQSTVEIAFNSDTHLLGSMAVSGVKGGVEGQHLHIYSNYVERCGVQMPSHNVKSFEGEVWVEEDVLELQCIDVDEAMFERPEQVADGYMQESKHQDIRVICAGEIASTDDPHGKQSDLETRISAAGFTALGPASEFMDEAGESMMCLPVQENDTIPVRGLSTLQVAAGRGLSIYALGSIDKRKDELVATLIDAVLELSFEPVWPVRITRFDNDGMGLTGEVIVELSVGMAD